MLVGGREGISISIATFYDVLLANLRVFHVTSPRNKALLSGIIKHHCPLIRPKISDARNKKTTLGFFPGKK